MSAGRRGKEAAGSQESVKRRWERVPGLEPRDPRAEGQSAGGTGQAILGQTPHGVCPPACLPGVPWAQSCLLVTPWMVARWAPLSMGFPR